MESLISRFSQIWQMILDIVGTFELKDILDVVIIALLVYGCIKLIRDTRAGQLIKGLLVLVIVYVLAKQLGMVMLSTILTQFVTFAVVALVILFQPEIRKALEQMGRKNMGRTITGIFSDKDRLNGNPLVMEVIDNVVETATILQQMRMGALIVFERATKLNEIAATGTTIDANATSQLMGNIFFNKAPLHDGAVIIRDGRILSAGCILPLTGRTNVHANLGTRHRAALGISEDSDAIAVVVSEETGQISIAQNGVLTRNYSRMTLKETLEELLLSQSDSGEGRRNILRKLKLTVKKEGGAKDEK